MARQRVFDFQGGHKGLWVSGPRDRTPADALRRARGVHSIRERQLRSRNGSTADAAIAAAHSLFKFNAIRFQAASTFLYRNAVQISSGLDGTALSFVASEPRSGTNARYLFLAGGGKLEKVDTSGTVTKWGIAAPSIAELTATVTTVVPPQQTPIDLFEEITGVTSDIDTRTLSRTAAEGTRIQAVTNNLDIIDFEEGIASIRFGHGAYDSQTSGTGRTMGQRVLYLTPRDLTVHTNGDESPLGDFIRIRIKLSNQMASFLTGIRVTFENTGNNIAIFNVNIDNSSQVPFSDPGLVDVAPEVTDNDSWDSEESSAEAFSPGQGSTGDQAILLAMSNSTLSSVPDTWQELSMPKSGFQRIGTFDWAAVTAYQTIFTMANGGEIANDNTAIKLDDLHLSGGGNDTSGAGGGGGGGLQGTYKYKFTYRNSTTGNRSNAGIGTDGFDFIVTAENVDRGSVSFTGLPVSADSQVDQREVWRTVGNGRRYFLAGRIEDNTTTTYIDDVADFAALSDITDVVLLGTDELPTDNADPDDDFEDVVIDKLTAFWTSNGVGKRGRLYFSPIGRPESQKGFINVSSDADPSQRVILWDGRKWLFSESKVFRIDGDFTIPGQEVYISREVRGVPGVVFASRRTIVSTPSGIIYQSSDGVRVFTGNASTLLANEPISPLVRGEAAENLTAFEGTVATYARDEYIISDDTQCLAMSATDRTWRDLGYTDITALYHEPDTDAIQAGRTSAVHLIDDEGTASDGGSAIPVAWESAAIDIQGEQVQVIEDVYIELDANGGSITPTIVHKDGTLALTAITPTGRKTSTQEINRLFQVPGLRLTGSVSAEVILYSAEFESRPLQLGITSVDSNQRAQFNGRSVALATSVIFEIPAEDRQLDVLSRLYVVERIVIEANTASANVTPSIQLSGGTSTNLTAVNTSTRAFTEISIGRLGPITGLTLTGDFTANVQIFGIELFIRPVVMEVSLMGNGTVHKIDGFTSDAATSITFDLDAWNREMAGELLVPIIDRLTIEGNTASNSVTSAINVNEGASITGPTISSSSRQQRTSDIDRVGRVTSVVLTADFLANAIAIYSVELVMRALPLNITFLRDSE